MEEETTTTAPVATGAQVIGGVPVDNEGNALPDMQADTTAAESTTTGEETQATSQQATDDQSQNQTTTEPTASSDDELASWAKNKGLELDSDNTKKAAKIARDNELAFKRKAQQASELEKNVGAVSDQVIDQNTPQGQDNEVLKRLQNMEVKAAVRDFWDSNPEARDYEAQMIEIIKTKPYLAGDLPVLYAYAKGQDQNTAKRDILTDLASKQQTAVPTGAATNAQKMSGIEKITPQNVDKLVGDHDLKWFMDNQDAINAAMAG